MDLSIQQWGQIITLVMIAVALGLDAFSLGLGVGIKRISYKKMISISLFIGLMHVLMPLLGMYLGQFLSMYMKEIATMVGGGMLCFLGINMLMSLVRKESTQSRICIDSLVTLGFLSFSVSLDSLSAGLSLGLFNADRWLAITFFGSIGAAMTGGGMFLGRSVGHWLGRYGEAVGGIILLILGSKFLC